MKEYNTEHFWCHRTAQNHRKWKHHQSFNFYRNSHQFVLCFVGETLQKVKLFSLFILNSNCTHFNLNICLQWNFNYDNVLYFWFKKSQKMLLNSNLWTSSNLPFLHVLPFYCIWTQLIRFVWTWKIRNDHTDSMWTLFYRLLQSQNNHQDIFMMNSCGFFVCAVLFSVLFVWKVIELFFFFNFNLPCISIMWDKLLHEDKGIQ